MFLSYYNFIKENKVSNKFEEYIKRKLLIDELSFLAEGSEGIVFSYKKNGKWFKGRIIKFTNSNTDQGFYGKLVNKNLDGVVKVYSYGKMFIPKNVLKDLNWYSRDIQFGDYINYVILEDLKISYDEDLLVEDIYHDLQKTWNFFRTKEKEKFNIPNNLWLSFFLYSKKDFYDKVYPFFIKELDSIKHKMLDDLRNGCMNLFNLGIMNIDLHGGNVLIDKNGNFKIIDPMDNSHPIKHWKNLIKENH